MTADEFPMGAVVRYTARGEVAQDDSGPVTASGFVNGNPYLDDDGQVEYVPVWSKRDHGREATTIVVHIENVIAVEPPKVSA